MIDARYELRETPETDYLQRTEWNVRDSDATVIFSLTETLGGGETPERFSAETSTAYIEHSRTACKR